MVDQFDLCQRMCRTACNTFGDMNYVQQHWKNLLAIIFVIALSFSGNDWLWGVLFIAWFTQGIYYKETFLLETVKKDDSEVMYWTILILWLGMAIYSFSALLYPNYY